MLKLQHVGASDKGKVRSKNEDFWEASPEDSVFIIADGMGGRLAGEVASKEAVRRFVEIFKKERNLFPSKNSEQQKQFFYSILSQVNNWVYGKGISDSSLSGMGTTLTSIYFSKKKVFISHVGDSRLYRLRKKKLKQLTEDHSLMNFMANENYDEKICSRYKHILTNVVGIRPKLEADIMCSSYRKNDIFLLCSDGLTNSVTDEEMTMLLVEDTSLEKKVDMLIMLANSRGGIDNITVLLIKVL